MLNTIMKKFIALLLLLVPFSAAEAFEVKGVQPLPPFGVFSTFSAESLKQGKVGLGFTYEHSFDPDFNRLIGQLAYGLHDRFEINATLPYVNEWEQRFDGFEDLHLGFKHRILDEGRLSPAVAYMLTLSVPSGKEEFSTGGVGGGLLVTKKVGPFKGHVNLLYSKSVKGEVDEQYALNAGAELAIAHNSKVLAEIVGKKNFFRSKIDLVEWRLGYRLAASESLFTTVGAGFDIKNRTPDFRLFLTISVILPVEKRRLQRIYE